MENSGKLYRYAAFTDRPDGGNPAGVWIGPELPPVEEMQRIAAEVGFSETAFIAPQTGRYRTVRYYSPEAEVSFCGHATIASGVLLGESGGDGVFRLSTLVGEVQVDIQTESGMRMASLTSVPPRVRAVPGELLAEALAALDWPAADLDPHIPPALAYAGAWHLVIAAGEKRRLDMLAYDFQRLKALMLQENLTTLQLVWRASEDVFHARNPFPVGGVVEDPATGAAAAALGGYLRAAGLIRPPARLRIHQGAHIGRPGLLQVEIPESGGIVVAGAAVPMD